MHYLFSFLAYRLYLSFTSQLSIIAYERDDFIHSQFRELSLYIVNLEDISFFSWVNLLKMTEHQKGDMDTIQKEQDAHLAWGTSLGNTE